MSKNVAVFVDVANIFYAAKAAGVDIDYVTLLKSSIAGRDFVRAYAYTGLDPDNENQRQFHSFLARNGYKVVSKDIRKYGDGRIKANLDIELVVDLMRMARNLDIAVVVSGDGDFAPAIRAVQQMGVRVEVVSFRGNTSSDLIEVADAFTDIAQIARVDKGSARSGRRVAVEGDLSMTAVPEKETEGAPRRRRSRGGRTAEAEPAATEAGAPANLIVLPGERLSRAPEDELPALGADELPADAEGEAPDASEVGEDGRRRRRRRGGRGRGRGRRDATETPTEVGVVGTTSVAGEEDEEEEFEPLEPAQLPHHTFGSVWDTQLGVPSASMAASTEALADDEEYEDEPEIPEYLLAERRQRGQRGQRGRMGGRGRAAGYQAAVERERYGRAGAGSFGGPRLPERQRPDRSRPQRGGGRPQRDQRPPRQEPRQPERAASSGTQTPWSEVPPEIEELLRAELARQAPPRGPQPGPSAAPPSAQPATEPEDGAPPTDAAADRPRRRRTTRADGDESTAGVGAASSDGEAAPAKPARAPRRRAPAAPASAEGATDGATAEGSADEPAKPRRRTTRTARAAATPATGEADAAGAADAAGDATKPVRRRRTTKAADTGSESPDGA